MGSRRTFGFSLLASALRSFARAIFCNCRIRSLVTPNFFPISSENFRFAALQPESHQDNLALAVVQHFQKLAN